MPGGSPTSRAREQVGGDEEATSDLKLGEFQNVHSMSLSEARALIIAILAHRATTKKVEETEYVLCFDPSPGDGVVRTQGRGRLEGKRKKGNEADSFKMAGP